MTDTDTSVQAPPSLDQLVADFNAPNDTPKIPEAATTDTPKTPETSDQYQQERAERKAYLQADKERNQARQEAKAAKEKLKRLEAIEKAASSDDPREVLIAAGLDPDLYYKKVIDYSKKKKDPVDPVELKVKEHLTAYEQRIKEQELKIQQQAEEMQTNNTIAYQIIPVLTAAPQDYEALFLLKGNSTEVAKYVYATALNIKKEHGEMPDFKILAQTLENHHWAELEAGHNAVSKLNKFSAKYSSQAIKPPSVADTRTETLQKKYTETPNAANNNVKPPQTTNEPPKDLFTQPTDDERLEAAMKLIMRG